MDRQQVRACPLRAESSHTVLRDTRSRLMSTPLIYASRVPSHPTTRSVHAPRLLIQNNTLAAGLSRPKQFASVVNLPSHVYLYCSQRQTRRRIGKQTPEEKKDEKKNEFLSRQTTCHTDSTAQHGIQTADEKRPQPFLNRRYNSSDARL